MRELIRKKAYLFLYDDDVGTRDEVKSVINNMKRVETWRFDLPYCFYVISGSSAQDLYEEFISSNGSKGRFIFIEASTNSQGLMMPATWYLLLHKSHEPKGG